VYVPVKAARPTLAGAEAPAASPSTIERVRATEPVAPPPVSLLTDDSASIQPGDRVLLVVENDLSFAQILMDLARERGFKAVVAARGVAGLTAAQKYRPAAITLDINLPDVDGWRVLERLKDASTLRHIPVHVITTDDERERALRMGAMGALVKPLKSREALDEVFERIEVLLQPTPRSLVIVDGEPGRRAAIGALLVGTQVDVRAFATGAEPARSRDRRPICWSSGRISPTSRARSSSRRSHSRRIWPTSPSWRIRPRIWRPRRVSSSSIWPTACRSRTCALSSGWWTR
jgi:CheY-like chemotaxis protein